MGLFGDNAQQSQRWAGYNILKIGPAEQLKEFLLVCDVPVSNLRKGIVVKSCSAAHMLGLKPKMTSGQVETL